MKKIFFLLFLLTFSAVSLSGQKVAVKNNLLYDAGLTPNLGIEFALGRSTTMDVSASLNPFSLKDDLQWKHWLVQPEFRLWLCERFNGSFFGIHALGGEYSFTGFKFPFDFFSEMKDYRYEGYFYGGGVSFGHQWIISPHWSFEAVIGVGYARVHYEKYNCETCSSLVDKGAKNWFGPTKASLAFLLFF